VRRFTTIALPGIVVLAGPPVDTTFASSTVTLSWQPVVLADFYWVEWSADSSFSESFVDSTVTGTSRSIASLSDSTVYFWRVRATSRSIASLSDSTVYFWRVRAGNGAGWGAFSDTRGFATQFSAVVSIPLAAGWNMVSNPVITAHDSVSELFPGSVFTHAFAFEATTGYAQSSRMLLGTGYWAKFTDDQVQTVNGLTCTSDTILVQSGWNMVGSISMPVDTGSIVSIPPGLRSSVWYGYSGAYSPATQLIPGQAYWVKAAGDGMFVLTIPTLAPPARAAGSVKRRDAQHPDSAGTQQLPEKARQR